MSRVQVKSDYFSQTAARNQQAAATQRSANQFGTTTICQVYCQTALAFTIGWNKVLYDTVENDPNGLFDLVNHRYIVPTTGFYMVSSQTDLSYASGSGPFYVALRKGGVEHKRGPRCVISTTDSWALSFAPLHDADAGNYVEIWAYVSQPAVLTVGDAPLAEAENWLTIARVA